MQPFDLRGQQLCKFVGTKEKFYMRKSSTPTGLVWDTVMAAGTSCENALYNHCYSLFLLYIPT